MPSCLKCHRVSKTQIGQNGKCWSCNNPELSRQYRKKHKKVKINVDDILKQLEKERYK